MPHFPGDVDISMAHHNRQLPIADCLLPIAFCFLPIAHCQLSFAYCLLPIVFCPLPIADCLLPIVHLLPIAYWFYLSHQTLSVSRADWAPCGFEVISTCG